MTLDELPEAYRAARAAAIASAPLAEPQRNTCRYCGRHWIRHISSINDGHARCIVTAEFLAAVGALWWSTPGLTRDAIAAACGVTKSTVWRWTNPMRINTVRSMEAR
jgi:hypothetical protein